MPAVDLAVDKGLELLAQLSPWVREFDGVMRSGATSFSLRNETYGSVDAERCTRSCGTYGRRKWWNWGPAARAT